MSIFITLIRDFYVPYFTDENNDGYKLLCSSVTVNILSNRYREFVMDGDAAELESLPKEKKEFFWKYAIKYYDTTEKRKMACEAAYALELITGKN